MRILIIGLVLALAACRVERPEHIAPVSAFQSERYLGTWYEIARIDNRFEKGLSRVSAEYKANPDGGITVINRGYEAASGQWKQSIGKAYFVEGKDTGFLKVSFFGPFYGAYVVFDLDQDDYSYALVGGPDTSYFWLLSRSPSMDPVLRQALIDKAVAKGYQRNRIINVAQTAPVQSQRP